MRTKNVLNRTNLNIHDPVKDVTDARIKDIVNVTMNRLKIFKAYVEASLNKADERWWWNRRTRT